ncbi:hypothetical protein ACWDRX_27005, partial [Streptomyces nigra]
RWSSAPDAKVTLPNVSAAAAPVTKSARRPRPANPQLLRQRLFVFVVVTLLVALGIAAAQGCQGPDRGLGGTGGPPAQERVAPDHGTMDDRYSSEFEIPE